MSTTKLDWWEEDSLTYKAYSAVHDDGTPYLWQIGASEVHGILYFHVANSTEELLPKGADEMLFRRVDDAKLFCFVVEESFEGWGKFEQEEIETNKLKAKVERLCAVMRTVNFSKHHEINIDEDDDPCYWQTKEWCKYILDVANNLDPNTQ